MPSVLNELFCLGQSKKLLLWEGGRGREGRWERELHMEVGGNSRLNASQCNSSLRIAKSSIMLTKIIKCLI